MKKLYKLLRKNLFIFSSKNVLEKVHQQRTFIKKASQGRHSMENSNQVLKLKYITLDAVNH